MNIVHSQNAERSLLRQTVLLSLLVCGFLVLIDQLSVHWGLGIWQRIADDITGGIIAASIFYLYERRARREFREHLRLVDLMNHHVRNALQPLMFVPFQLETAVQKQLVEECVNHIDWALREILPGKSKDRFLMQAAALSGNNSAVLAGSYETSSIEPDLIEAIPISSMENGPIEGTAESSANSMDFGHSGVGPENAQSQAFFGQWFENWVDRVKAIPDEAVGDGFGDSVNSDPWKNYRAAFRGRKQTGNHA
jgi:hypothetical protein